MGEIVLYQTAYFPGREGLEREVVRKTRVVTVEGVDQDHVAGGHETTEHPFDPAFELLFGEDVGLELEQEDQDHPGHVIDRDGESLQDGPETCAGVEIAKCNQIFPQVVEKIDHQQ